MLEIKYINYPLAFITEDNENKNTEEFKFYSKKIDDNQFNLSVFVDLIVNNVKIGISCNATFNLDIEIIRSKVNDEEKIPEFINRLKEINAPALVFPYVRAYISNLLVNSGYPGYFIKSIDFIARYNNTIEKE